MTDHFNETWKEIKEGLYTFFQVLMYSFLALGVLLGGGYAVWEWAQ